MFGMVILIIGVMCVVGVFRQWAKTKPPKRGEHKT